MTPFLACSNIDTASLPSQDGARAGLLPLTHARKAPSEAP